MLRGEPRIGGHLQIRGELRHLIVQARGLGYNVVQTMLGGSTDYTPYEFEGKDVAEFKKMAYGISLYVHLPYIINPCEGKPQRRGFYKRTMRQYCELASAFGARGVVLHPGFKKDLTEKEAQKNAIRFLEESFEGDWKTDILLETDAGSKNGSAIGGEDFIAGVLKELDNTTFGLCIDTTHLYARGTDLWDGEVRKTFLGENEKYIRLVHLNVPDPEVELGSHRDRHNTPFEERKGWDHDPMVRDMIGRFPCVLERRSLCVQQKDITYLKGLLIKG